MVFHVEQVIFVNIRVHCRYFSWIIIKAMRVNGHKESKPIYCA